MREFVSDPRVLPEREGRLIVVGLCRLSFSATEQVRRHGHLTLFLWMEREFATFLGLTKEHNQAPIDNLLSYAEFESHSEADINSHTAYIHPGAYLLP